MRRCFYHTAIIEFDAAQKVGVRTGPLYAQHLRACNNPGLVLAKVNFDLCSLVIEFPFHVELFICRTYLGRPK